MQLSRFRPRSLALVLLPFVSVELSQAAAQCPPAPKLPSIGDSPRLGNPTTPPSQTTRFGYSLAATGDVNGDCYPDYVVGADSKAWLYFGSASFGDTTGSKLLLDGSDNVAVTNRYVSGVGDLDGDGYPDVGANQTAANSVMVYRGGVSMDGAGDQSFRSQFPFLNSGPRMGIQLGGGDFDGDGYDDLIAAELGFNFNGRVYVFFGGPNIFSGAPKTHDAVLQAPSFSTGFGSSLAFVGDVNGDSYEDFAVGDPGNDRAYVYLGNPQRSFSTRRQLTTSGLPGLGASVAGGDVNRDGFDDVLVGGVSSTSPGGIRLYHGSASFGSTSQADWSVDRPAGLGITYYGAAVAMSDVDGDGRAEIVVGEPEYPAAGGLSGAVWSYMRPTENAAYLSAYGSSTSDEIGWRVAAIGDADWDGVSDLVTGGYFQSGSGSSIWPLVGQVHCQGPNPGDYSGDNVVSLPDVSLFTQYWNSGSLQADLNCDGALSLSDVGQFAALQGWVYP